MALVRWPSAFHSASGSKESGCSAYSMTYPVFADMGGFVSHTTYKPSIPKISKQLHCLVTQEDSELPVIYVDVTKSKNKIDAFVCTSNDHRSDVMIRPELHQTSYPASHDNKLRAYDTCFHHLYTWNILLLGLRVVRCRYTMYPGNQDTSCRNT